MTKQLLKLIRTKNAKLAFLAVLFAVVIAWTLWVTFNQIGDLPPLVARHFVDIGVK